ncbi:MAG: hypothetical protein GYA57_13805 [Myxococcales bacterium]|nr:hypothetical protein [Myxococcales bacterium]
MRITTARPGLYAARPRRDPQSRIRGCDPRLGMAATALLLTAAAPSCRRPSEAEAELDAQA